MNFRKEVLLLLFVLFDMICAAQIVEVRPEYEWMLKDITVCKLHIDSTNYTDYCILLYGKELMQLDSTGTFKNGFPNAPISLKFYKKDGDDLKFVGNWILKGTYEMPRPTAKINGVSCGFINKDTLVHAIITADFNEFKIDKTFEILGFEFIVTRGSKTIIAGNTSSPSFTANQKADILRLARSGDRILFYEIVTSEEYFLNVHLNSIELKIK